MAVIQLTSGAAGNLQRADLDIALKLQKVPKLYKAVLQGYHDGKSVDQDHLLTAIMFAMRCSATSAGQSAERRRRTEACERIWLRLEQTRGIMPLATAQDVQASVLYDLPASTDRPAVEAWLDTA